MLTTIDHVLTPDEVRQFRAHLDQAAWQSGADSAGTLARKVKANEQLDDSADPAVKLGNHILRCLGRNTLFVSAALPRKIYPPKFNRYTVGGGYGTHIDSAVMHIPGTSESLRSDLAATLFLSAPGEYDGGELQIETAFGAQNVKLDAGSMVVYPASSLHRVAPVTRGARVASFFWIESMVADDSARTLLFDLDRTIQTITPALDADQHSLVQLTGIYHNLLRRWAST